MQPYRGRSFEFKISNYKKGDWKNICSMKSSKICEHIFAGKDNTEINGFIKFANAKSIKTVEKLFNNKAIIEVKRRNDKYYKELYSKYEHYNSDDTKALEDRIKEQEKIISIVETQNTKLMQNNETMIEFINAFKNSKENDSEQIRQITDLCMKIAKSTPTMVVNNTNNNFNLNVFLNEYCKDAVNIFDFAKSIQIELEDVLLFKKLGHVEAVSQIFDKAYKNLDLKMRPMHCTDVKRETLYVRNDDKWVNDETKEISKSAVEKISNNSYCKMQLWKEANPDYMQNPEKKQEYLLLMKEVLGGSSDKDFEDNSKRILKNLSKNTHLDKTNALVVV